MEISTHRAEVYFFKVIHASSKTHLKGMIVMTEKKKKEKPKFTLTSAQEVGYQRDFKMADRAGGYNERRTKH